MSDRLKLINAQVWDINYPYQVYDAMSLITRPHKIMPILIQNAWYANDNGGVR
jgi:hypothetical protein